MQIDHIIIQAGGLGTRLGKLTKNKPKCIVTVNNRPIIFHLFEKYPLARFVIIGDYKYPILKNYLQTFAKVDFILIQSMGKGNAAGINTVLEHVPDGTSFMLIWSDVLLSKDLCLQDIPDGNYIGLTTNFPCSWHMDNGVLKKTPNGIRGVAGLFLFTDKAALKGLPDEGSFTKWLQESALDLKPLDLLNSCEAGTIESIRKIDSGENRCRPYNALDFQENSVKKTALTKEGQKLIDRETLWYRKMREYGFPYIPQIYSYNPLTMSRIKGKNIFSAKLDERGKRQVIAQMVNALNLMHSYGCRPADWESLNEEYFEKTLRRLDSIKKSIPLSNDKYIIINGKPCHNVLFHRELFLKMIKERLVCTEFYPIHGDGTLTNTMINEMNNIYFIDARGYFGKNEVFGDVYYDWAKLYYSIHGNFDQFNIKNFDLEIGEKEIHYQIKSNGWENLTEYYLNLIADCNKAKIELIHAIIWLSLASHCWEDFDSLCAAFYVGTSLLEDCW